MKKNIVLIHYGVKGMQWGVRKDKRGGSKSNSVKKLSDSELKARVARLNLERQYASLTSSSGNKKSLATRGSKIVTEILGNAIKQVATQRLVGVINTTIDDKILK